MGITVFADFKLLLVRIVAWINPDFFHPFCGFERGIGFKMNVGDERDLASRSAHAVCDVLEIRGVGRGLGRDAHHFTTGVGEGEHLGDAGVGVAGVGGDHGLHADGMVAAHGQMADAHFAGEAAGIVEQIRAITQGRGNIHRPARYSRDERPRQRQCGAAYAQISAMRRGGARKKDRHPRW